MSITELRQIAQRLRWDIIRSAAGAPGATHIGPAFSITDICTVLYFEAMRVKPDNPAWPDRDRLILSKGHAYQALYAALAEKGYFDLDKLDTLRHLHSSLQGHPDMNKTPGVDMTSGSLGNGLGIGVGMALAGRLDKKDYNVFVILGDGESQEGSVWEAAMAAAHYQLDKLIAFVDCNGFQSGGRVEETMTIEPVRQKWESFGWRVEEIDGHDFAQISSFIARSRESQGKPSVAIASTTKGKGVSFIENNNTWHMCGITDEQINQAHQEIFGEAKDGGAA